MEKKLFLLDGMALIYRAYFAFIRNPMINSNGVDTSAIFGFLNTLLEILDNHNPTHIALALDVSGGTFRHEMFPEYKAQREKTPDGILTAVPVIRELLEAFRIPVIAQPGFEADDLIGTLARRAETEGFTTYMVTGDKDFAQLVDEHTFIYKPGRKGSGAEVLGVKEVLEQWGLQRVGQVVDLLGLAGDAADNIPGVPGVGPKTAQKLIEQYGTVEELLAHTADLKGKLKENLEANREKALLSKKLVTIHCAVPLELDPAGLQRGEPDADRLKALLREYELNSIYKRLFAGEPAPPAPPSAPPSGRPVQGDLFALPTAAVEPPAAEGPARRSLADVPHTYRLIRTLEELDEILPELMRAELLCFDTETTGLDTRRAQLVGIAFAVRPGETFFVHFPEAPEKATERLERLRPLFENDADKLGHHLKFDLSVLKWHGVTVRGRMLDTMLAHYLLDPDQRHTLNHLAEVLLNYEPVLIESLIGKRGAGQKSMREVPLETLCDYGCEDADLTLQLWEKLRPQLAENGLDRVFYEIETPLLPVLVEMEYAGIALDTAALQAYSKELERKIAELEEAVYDAAGGSFNLNSPKQLGEVLFDRMKLSEKPKKTATGQYATGEEVLQSLVGRHPVVERILTWRGLTKLKSTYVDALPDEVLPRTGRVHTTYSQAVTTTGRLSSVNPNLQNIPIRSEEGREIRRAFIPAPGFQLLACDYSQIELRIMAALSGDEALQTAFRSGADIHAATAAKVYGIASDAVDREMRRKAKMVNFGIIYGISAFGLAQRLGIPRGEAAELIESYFKLYPGVRAYMERTVEKAREQGFVETLTGRRRYIRDIHVRNGTVRQAAERNAINAPIQGTAADMIKIAMIQIQHVLEERQARTRMLLQVHDELVFELAPQEADELVPRLETVMREALPLEVPVVVDSGIGANWLEAH